MFKKMVPPSANAQALTQMRTQMAQMQAQVSPVEQANNAQALPALPPLTPEVVASLRERLLAQQRPLTAQEEAAPSNAPSNAQSTNGALPSSRFFSTDSHGPVAARLGDDGQYYARIDGNRYRVEQ